MLNSEEVWKDVVGYEGKYRVSNYGNVLKQNGKPMSICNNGNGYSVVYLCVNNKRKTKLVHRLVAEAFIPNENELPEVNHKDENKQNNYIENLEWCTSSYNANYGTKIRRMTNHDNYIKAQKEKMGRAPKPSLRKQIAQYDKDGNLLRVWNGAYEAKNELGFDSSGITKCCKGKMKTYKSFVWEYAN